MIRMMKMIIGALLIAAVSMPLQAQRGMHKLPSLDKLTETLSLTDQQIAQLETLEAKMKKEMEAIRSAEFENPEDRRAAMMEMRESMKSEMESILTEEQLAKLEENRAERHENMKAKREEMVEKRKEVHEKMKEKREEARAYKEENMMPVLREQRTKLDQSISEEDKQTIAKLRVHFKEQKEERIAEMKTKHEERVGKIKENRQERKGRMERPDRDEMMKERKALREKRQLHKESEEAQTLNSLLEKYQSDIDQVMGEIEAEQAEWDNDLKEIMKTEEGMELRRHDRHSKHMHRPHQKEMKENENQIIEEVKEQKERGRQHRKRLHKDSDHKKAAHFLLMDPNQNNSSMTDGLQSAIQNVNVYPNPTSQEANLNFELVSDVKTRIELRDEAGNLVKTFANKKFNIGKVNTQLDLSQVKNGIYYVVIIGKDGSTQTTQLVVSR